VRNSDVRHDREAEPGSRGAFVEADAAFARPVGVLLGQSGAVVVDTQHEA
jgi:hypothetical protein